MMIWWIHTPNSRLWQHKCGFSTELLTVNELLDESGTAMLKKMKSPTHWQSLWNKKFDSNLRNSESYVLPQCASNVYKRFFVNWCFCSLVLSLTSFTHTVLHFFHECLLLDFNKVWVWLCYGRLCHSFNFTTLCVYRWLTAQWWLFDKTEISILGEIARAFPHLWTKCGILICYRNEVKMTLLKQFTVHQTWLDVQRHYVHSTLPRRF